MTRGHDTDPYARYRPGGEPGEQRRDSTVETSAQDPAPSVAPVRHRLRVAGLVAAATGVAAVVTAGAFLVAGPHLRAPEATGSTGGGTLASLIGSSTPSPIAGPITPAAFPYDDLAILRRQRLSSDVLPADTFRTTGASDTPIVADSARLLATKGHDRLYVAANASGGVCTLFTDDGTGGGGYNSGCSTAGSASPGELVDAVGFGSGLDVKIFADGAPKASETAGYRQVAPNTWLKRGVHGVVAAPAPATVAGDPYAYPLAEPYSDFAILRRPQTVKDILPAALTDEDTSADDVLSTSIRFAGVYRGTSTWVGVMTDGAVCLLLDEPSSGGLTAGCGGPPAAGGVGIGAATTARAAPSPS